MTEQTRSLHRKLAAITAEVGPVEKDGEVKNKAGGRMYQYTTANEVYGATRQLMAAKGVSHSFSSKLSESGPPYLEGTIKFTDVDTGETEVITGVGIIPTGDAMVTYKAMTSLHRHMIMKQFMLTDGKHDVEEYSGGFGGQQQPPPGVYMGQPNPNPPPQQWGQQGQQWGPYDQAPPQYSTPPVGSGQPPQTQSQPQQAPPPQQQPQAPPPQQDGQSQWGPPPEQQYQQVNQGQPVEAQQQFTPPPPPAQPAFVPQAGPAPQSENGGLPISDAQKNLAFMSAGRVGMVNKDDGKPNESMIDTAASYVTGGRARSLADMTRTDMDPLMQFFQEYGKDPATQKAELIRHYAEIHGKTGATVHQGVPPQQEAQA